MDIETTVSHKHGNLERVWHSHEIDNNPNAIGYNPDYKACLLLLIDENIAAHCKREGNQRYYVYCREPIRHAFSFLFHNLLKTKTPKSFVGLSGVGKLGTKFSNLCLISRATSVFRGAAHTPEDSAHIFNH